MTPLLKPGERLDALQCRGYRLIQRPDCFCLGTDSVLLADFAAPRPGERAVDLGCGNGAIALLLAAHQPSIASIDAIELQPELADMALRSVALNALEGKIRVRCLDLRSADQALGRGAHSLVVCNPPYCAQGSAIESARAAQRLARHEGDIALADVTRAAAALLKCGGRFCTVFPARRAFEMMCAMQACGLAPKRLRSVHADPDRPPRVVLLDAVKGGGSQLDWRPPLYLRGADGKNSAEWERIYGER